MAASVCTLAFFLNASDSGPFVRDEVPVLSFLSGMHGDYHQPADDADTIDADKAAKTARIAFLAALEVVIAELRPGFQKQRSEGLFPIEPDAPSEAGLGHDGLTKRITARLGAGKSPEELQRIIKEEFGVEVQVQIGGGRSRGSATHGVRPTFRELAGEVG